MLREPKALDMGLNTGGNATNGYVYKDDMSLEDRAKLAVSLLRDACRRDLATSDVDYFVQFVVSWAGITHLEPFQKEWLQFVLSCPPDGKRLILAPRGFGKSTILTYIYVLYLVVCGPPNIRVLVLTKNENEARDTFNRKFEFLKNSPEIARWFPDLVTKSSATDLSLTTSRRTNFSLREPTLLVKSMNSSITGRHFDYVVFDDVFDGDSVDTESKRSRLIDYYNRAIQPTADPGCKMIAVATRYHVLDLAAYWIESAGWEHKTYTIIKSDGKPLWPARWPMEAIERIQANMTFSSFQSQYMNRVDLLPRQKLIREEDIKRYMNAAIVDMKADGKLTTYIGVDPAISTSPSADYCGLVVVSRDIDSNYYVRYAIQGKFSMYETVHRIEELCALFTIEAIVVEVTGFQGALVEVLESRNFPVFGETPGKSGKLGRAKFVTTAAMKNKLFLPKEIDPDTSMHVLYEQLLFFPDCHHKDLYDALSIAMAYLSEPTKTTELLFF